jgi:hypothetical protein
MLVATVRADVFTLIQDGKSQCVVSTTGLAAAEESTAASWHAEYLQNVEKANVPLKSEDASDMQEVSVKLFVGETQAFPATNPRASPFGISVGMPRSKPSTLLLRKSVAISPRSIAIRNCGRSKWGTTRVQRSLFRDRWPERLLRTRSGTRERDRVPMPSGESRTGRAR